MQHVLITTVFFHAILWKKQTSNACFNLFLVLLLNPDSVAFTMYHTPHTVVYII